jgi:hypothetical protein
LEGGNSATFSPANLTDGATVSATLISSENCPLNETVISNDITVSVGNGILASVQISATHTQICEGALVSFVADVVNQGNNPIYQWLVNDNPVGENEAVFMSTLLEDSDMVTCRMTSSETCVVDNVVTSNGVVMTVSNSLEPSLTISTDSFYICQNSPVVFSTLAVNSGDNATFKWYVNSEDISESNPFLNINTLEDGDVITCQMTSTITCATINPVLSNPLTIGVNPECVYTGIGDVYDYLDFEIFPNPTNEQFTILIPTDMKDCDMIVTDVSGRVIFQKWLQNERNVIQVEDMIPGVYFVRLTKDNRVGVQKLVVF